MAREPISEEWKNIMFISEENQKKLFWDFRW